MIFATTALSQYEFGQLSGLSWSPDSRYLAFAHGPSGGAELKIWDSLAARGTLLSCNDASGEDVWIAEICSSGLSSVGSSSKSQHNLRFDNFRYADSPYGFDIERDRKDGTPMLVVWDESRRKPIRTLPLPDCGLSSWSPNGRMAAIDTCDRFVSKKETLFSEAEVEPRVLVIVSIKSLMHPCDWVTRNLTEDEWIKYVGLVPSRSTCDNLPSAIQPASMEDLSKGLRDGIGMVWYYYSGCGPCSYIRGFGDYFQSGGLLSLRRRLYGIGYLVGGLLSFLAVFVLALPFWLFGRHIIKKRL